MTEHSEHPVSAEVMAELKDVLADDFPLLVTTYLDDAHARMERLRAAAVVADMQTVKSEAHALKGSSKNLGAMQLGDLYAELELAGAGESSEEIPSLLTQAESELSRTESYLRNQL